jgi:hypothetical protein
MVVILYIFAALEFIGGIGVLVGSKDAIREIVGTLLVGFSIITAGACKHTCRGRLGPKAA